MGQKEFAIGAAALALGGGSEPVGATLILEGIRKDWQIIADFAASQGLAWRNREEAVGSAVGGQHNSHAIDGQYGGRTALRQKLQLFFGLAAQGLFAANVGEVADREFPIADESGHEQAQAGIREKREEETEEQFQRLRMGEIKGGPQSRTDDRQERGEAGRQHGSAHHDGDDVEQPQGRTSADRPIGERDQHNRNRREREHVRPVCLEEEGDHSFKIEFSGEREQSGRNQVLRSSRSRSVRTSGRRSPSRSFCRRRSATPTTSRWCNLLPKLFCSCNQRSCVRSRSSGQRRGGCGPRLTYTVGRPNELTSSEKG